MTLALTERGRAAALVVGRAVRSVDAELARRISADELAALRTALAALAELEHDVTPVIADR